MVTEGAKLMRYVLDTDPCIFWLKGNRAIEQQILQVGIEHIAVCVITACELAYGSWKPQRHHENLQTLDRLLQTLSMLHTTNRVAQVFGRWKARLEGKGVGLDDADLLIAAITYVHDGILVTHNQTYFARLPELRIDNWITPSSRSRGLS